MQLPLNDVVKSIAAQLPRQGMIAVLGSLEFSCGKNRSICQSIGRNLAGLPGVSLLTGGMEGVGETIGRAFYEERLKQAAPARIVHVLPADFDPLDYGETILLEEATMYERREVLARLCRLYVVVEGGPGTAHEAARAEVNGATVIPIGCTGGHALELYRTLGPPPWADREQWEILGSRSSSPLEIGQAVQELVAAWDHQ